ncbi:MAG: hypothetical protein IPM50_08870 [Acidobacteriota bacterium]|nr:MAG: hypothetical protein IPM50_08870 [Acidobacteriota bacterium]
MKRCPSCGADYADPNLNFCLNDGTLLENAGISSASDSEETVVMFQPDTSSTPPRPTQFQTPSIAPPPQKKGGSGVVKLLIGLVVAGFLFLVVAGVGVAAFFYFYAGSMTVKEEPRPHPPSSPPAAKKDPNKQLQDEIANLQKQIEEQKTGPDEYNVDLPIDLLDPRPATVNSPNDGFLALRSLPNSDIGQRIAKIPHGETITIGMCIDTGKAGGKKGNWCMARYGDKTGWVFDAYLIIQE